MCATHCQRGNCLTAGLSGQYMLIPGQSSIRFEIVRQSLLIGSFRLWLYTTVGSDLLLGRRCSTEERVLAFGHANRSAPPDRVRVANSGLTRVVYRRQNNQDT